MSEPRVHVARANLVLGLNDDGTLDEVIADLPVHLEQMDDGFWYLGIGDAQFWIHSDKPITIRWDLNEQHATRRVHGTDAAPLPWRTSEDAEKHPDGAGHP